ncbi:MAG: hypothetical protein EOO80_05315 [Oxalobacteraceae bacterium]|nr:MAG: hypothetical protein EOO80_05315 [Oxalobacteraceae bacterium]
MAGSLRSHDALLKLLVFSADHVQKSANLSASMYLLVAFCDLLKKLRGGVNMNQRRRCPVSTGIERPSRQLA